MVGSMHKKTISTNSYVTVQKQFRPIHAYIMTTMYPGVYTKALDEIKKSDILPAINGGASCGW